MSADIVHGWPWLLTVIAPTTVLATHWWIELRRHERASR